MNPGGCPVTVCGGLHARGYGMNAMCEKCRHRVDRDMQALIDKLGAGMGTRGNIVTHRGNA